MLCMKGSRTVLIGGFSFSFRVPLIFKKGAKKLGFWAVWDVVIVFCV